MRKLLTIVRNIVIIGLMLWMAFSYRDNHPFGPPKIINAATRSLS